MPDDTITVTPVSIQKRLRLKPGRESTDAYAPMWFWFLHWAQRNNHGIALGTLHLERDDDPSRREHAVVASVDVFPIPEGSGMKPGYEVRELLL